MSANALDEGLRVLRAVTAALGTDEGRQLARQIRAALDHATDEDTDGVQTYAQRVVARAVSGRPSREVRRRRQERPPK